MMCKGILLLHGLDWKFFHTYAVPRWSYTYNPLFQSGIAFRRQPDRQALGRTPSACNELKQFSSAYKISYPRHQYPHWCAVGHLFLYRRKCPLHAGIYVYRHYCPRGTMVEWIKLYDVRGPTEGRGQPCL